MSVVKSILLSIIVFCLVSACSDSKGFDERDEKLLTALNDAVEPFGHKDDISKARRLIVESMNRSLLERDSLVLVETVRSGGIYECVAYVYHNQMITFYNAQKGIEEADKFSKIEIQGTPFEALTFIDAIQMNSFDVFMNAREKDIPHSDSWWMITFLGKEQDVYSAKSYISK